MRFTLPEKVLQLFSKFKDQGNQIYLVGGAVRDLLEGKLVDDWDFTTDLAPEAVQKLFPGSFYDNQFGTVGIPVKGFDKVFEVTTFRTESGYKDRRRPAKVTWGKSLEEDLKRRDFTINAMALRLGEESPGSNLQADFRLVDPFKGQKDLEKKEIKAVGRADERFQEDALRMLRAIRFAAELNFKIERKTFAAIKLNAKLINKISKERVKIELFKILSSPNPMKGMEKLRESGLMAEILPELEKTFGVAQKSPGRHHVYDVGTHLFYSLKHCQSDDPLVRFATLIHDIGKPQTFQKRDGVITFYNHEVVSGRIAKRIAERLKFSKEESERLFKLVRFHQFTVDEKQQDKAIRRFIRRVGKENIKDMLDLRVGDRLGGGARETSWRLEEFKRRLIEVQKEPFTVHDLKITGNDVMKEIGIKPGPEVGRILEKLFNEVVEKEIPNEKRALTKFLKGLKKKP